MQIEKLKKYAKLLMFDMNENEYKILQSEFDVILKQMDLIGQIKDLDKVKPMTFPFELNSDYLREDEYENTITTEQFLTNVTEKSQNQVKVPKVVDND